MSQFIVYTDEKKTPNARIIEILRDKAGLNPDEDTARDELIKLCLDNDIQVVDERQAKAAAQQAKAATKDKKVVGYVINIQGAKDKKQLVVGVNGRHTMIKCDVDVTVKPEILEALRNAKEDFLEFVKDPMTQQVIDVEKRSIPAHPFFIKETVYG